MRQGWSLRTLLDGVAARGAAPALAAVRGEQVEYRAGGELAAEARRLASGLLAAGVEPGEPVALLAPNGPEWAVARLGLGAAGAVAVALDDLSSDEEASAFLRDSGARRLFTVGAHAAVAEQLQLDTFLLDAPAGEPRSWRRAFAEAPGQLPELRPDDHAMLVYTSGTTGAPKAFHLSYANIAANLDALLFENIVGPDDRVLLPLPLHHVYPLVVGLLTTLASGATLVFPEAVAGPQILRALKAARVTTIVGVPRLYSALLAGVESRLAGRGRLAAGAFHGLAGLSGAARRRLGVNAGRTLLAPLHRQFGPDLRLLVSGGAKLEAPAFVRLEALGWEVLSGYGLAETASIFTGNRPGQKRIGSEGRPLKGGEMRIGDPDAQGNGEIQLEGPSVFAGYRDNPEANRTAFTEDGWFRTGDLGWIDADGYLYVTGRAKELIVLGGGKNVFPEELEKIYGDSPYIREIAVLERQGALVALIVPEPDAIREAGYTRFEDVLRVTLAGKGRKLPSHQRLAGFAVSREPLPRTRLGKYQRFLLPDLYERARRGETRPKPVALSDEDRALVAAPPASEVWRLLQERYADRGLDMDASPQLDLGIDSLEWMTLALELEQRAGVALSEAEVAEVETVRDLVRKAAEAAERPVEAAAAEADERWLAPPGAAGRAFGLGAFGTNRALMRLLFRVETEGIENLPREGGYMLAVNHASDLDPPIMGAALPLHVMRRVYWGGNAKRLHSGPLRRAVSRSLHVFPVDERSPATALAVGAEVLRRGHVLIWFPEAWRSPTGEIQRFLPGVGRLLAETGAPVLPVWIAGTFEAMPRDAWLPRPTKVRVRIGRPLDPRELEARGEGANPYTRISSALQAEVAALAPTR